MILDLGIKIILRVDRLRPRLGAAILLIAISKLQCQPPSNITRWRHPNYTLILLTVNSAGYPITHTAFILQLMLVHLHSLFIHTACSSVHLYSLFTYAAYILQSSYSSIPSVYPSCLFTHTTCSLILPVHPHCLFICVTCSLTSPVHQHPLCTHTFLFTHTIYSPKLPIYLRHLFAHTAYSSI